MRIIFINLINELLVLVPYAVGFGYSLFAGLLICKTHKNLYIKFDDKSIGWRSLITGLVERGLYTGAMLARHLEFVGVWLVLKSVAHWDRFKSDTELDKGNVGATARFNNYFICTGLSIAYGLTGAYVTKWLIDCQYFLAIIVMIVLAVLHLVLNKYISCKAKEEEQRERINHSKNIGKK